MDRRRVLLSSALLFLLPGGPGTCSALADERAWSLLREPGHAALVRHAEAPGSGDPPGMRIGDCATQRNLGERGRDQARALGRAFAVRGLRATRVLSSQWCRCLETAELMALGPEVQELPALNSYFGDRLREPAQLAELRRFLAGIGPGERVILVSHHVVIGGLTGVYPGSGEVVVVRLLPGGEVSVAGRIASAAAPG